MISDMSRENETNGNQLENEAGRKNTTLWVLRVLHRSKGYSEGDKFCIT